MIDTQTKICSKCRLEKSFDCFRKEKGGRFGLRADCKECNKLYRVHHKDHIKETNAAYYRAKKKRLTLREKLASLEAENKALQEKLANKPTDTDDFIITNVQQGSGNWSGKAKIISLKSEDGKLNFDAAFKGSMEEATECLKNKKHWIGKLVEIKFNGYTGLGTPSFAQLDYNNALKGDR